MARITVREKNAAIALLVADTVRDRILSLQQDTNAHWNDIVSELYDTNTIKRNNKAVQTIFNQRGDDIGLAIEEDWNGIVEMLRNDDLRIREITHIHPERDSTDPLGVCPSGMFEEAYSPSKVFENIWNETGEPASVKLPTKMKYLTTYEAPRDHGSVCSIVDPDEYDDSSLEVDVDMHIPHDCRTQREFNKRANAIRDDMEKLTDTLRESIRNARSDTTVLATVPELEPYLVVSEEQIASVSDLLKKAKKD